MIIKWLNDLIDDGTMAFCVWFIPFVALLALFFASLQHNRIEAKKINDACLIQLKNGATNCPNVKGSSATYLTKKQKRLKRLGRSY